MVLCLSMFLDAYKDLVRPRCPGEMKGAATRVPQVLQPRRAGEGSTKVRCTTAVRAVAAESSSPGEGGFYIMARESCNQGCGRARKDEGQKMDLSRSLAGHVRSRVLDCWRRVQQAAPPRALSPPESEWPLHHCAAGDCRFACMGSQSPGPAWALHTGDTAAEPNTNTQGARRRPWLWYRRSPTCPRAGFHHSAKAFSRICLPPAGPTRTP
jgi:hypothetical protein